MKKYLLFGYFFLVFASCYSQTKMKDADIIGVWQLGSFEISSGYLDNYQFFKNGEFRFNLNQYDELKLIISIKGTYSISHDSISFKPYSLIKITGGDQLIRNPTCTLHDSWSLDGKISTIEIKLNRQEISLASLIIGKPKDWHANILIDGRQFFKILTNPDEY